MLSFRLLLNRHGRKHSDLVSFGPFNKLVAEALTRLATVGPGDISPDAAERFSHDDNLLLDLVDALVLTPRGGEELLGLFRVTHNDRVARKENE
jgi:hypothetical protein